MNLGNLNFFLIIIYLFISFSIQSKPIEGSLATIQILDKITARVETIEIKISSTYFLDPLKIEVYACYTNPPEEIPENFVLLKIFDKLNNQNEKLIYQGWMISSSPASSPLEHPIYDLWIKDCKI